MLVGRVFVHSLLTPPERLDFDEDLPPLDLSDIAKRYVFIVPFLFLTAQALQHQ